ncbi:transglutaminase domain-containing protein [uncultured Ruminococcus sp.]|uniref:transglutaminase domain-containing protein n=1 Tax=uncultured Ruminococcus sp. TaxID=165186 RepID=UPI0025F5C79C|nr:transglutaminase domain-containing protein [uncultured Ruminococcus sp.]
MTGKQRTKKAAAAAVSLFMILQFIPEDIVTAEYVIPSMPDFSYIGAVGSLSAEQTKKAAEASYEALCDRADQVDFSARGVSMNRRNENDLINIYRHVAACYDVGILAKKGTINYIPSRSIIKLSYLYEGDEYNEQYAAYSRRLDDILSGVDGSWSDEEKALYLHDYLSVKFDYDYPAYYGAVTRPDREQYSAYGMLKNGMAVCEGYSELYAKLMNRLGIHTELVTSDSLSHAWNIVNIDGGRYFVDVAWDDSYCGYSGIVKHSNFMKTASEIASENHDTSDWQDVFGRNLYSLDVPDTFSDAFWNDSRAAVKPYDGGWIVIKGKPGSVTAELVKYDGAAHKEASVKTLVTIGSPDSVWYVWENPRAYWTESFTVSEVVNGVIYYTTPTAVYALYNGKKEKAYELTEAEKNTGYIYGMYSDGNTMYYGLATEYDHVDNKGNAAIKYSGVAVSVLEANINAVPTVTTTASTTTTTTTTKTTSTTSKTTTTTTKTTTTTTKLTTTTTKTTTTTSKPTTTTTKTTTTTSKPTTTTTKTTTTTSKPTTTTTKTTTTTSKPTTTAKKTTTTTSKPTTTTTKTTTTTTKPTTTTTKTTTTTSKPTTTTTKTTTTTSKTTTTKPTTTTTKTTTTTTAKPKQKRAGDANGDGFVDMSDAVLIMQVLANPNKYGLNGSDPTHITMQGIADGDVEGSGNGITSNDALAIQKYLLKLVKSLPV